MTTLLELLATMQEEKPEEEFQHILQGPLGCFTLSKDKPKKIHGQYVYPNVSYTLHIGRYNIPKTLCGILVTRYLSSVQEPRLNPINKISQH